MLAIRQSAAGIGPEGWGHGWGRSLTLRCGMLHTVMVLLSLPGAAAAGPCFAWALMEGRHSEFQQTSYLSGEACHRS